MKPFTMSDRAAKLLAAGYEDPARSEYVLWRAGAVAAAKGDERAVPKWAAYRNGVKCCSPREHDGCT